MAATGHSHSETVQNPGPYEISSGLKTLFLVFVAIGVLAFAAGLSMDARRTWASFLLNHFYFMTLALGGLFLAALHWLTSAMWSAPIRRISESFTAYLPIALVGVVVLFFGMHHLYLWTDASHVKGDVVLEGKSGWLSIVPFIVRNLVFVLIWMFFTKKMIGNSLTQDTAIDPALMTKRNRAMSPGFMIIFALTYTLSSFDQMMSLDPKWFSTMFGVYCFAGLFYSSLAMTCLVMLYLKSQKRLDGIVNDNHLHDLGKYMFAFTIFWAYIAFSQFMLIWYANMPEETSYFLHRFHGCWMYVSIYLLVGKFMVPFFLLLPRDAKRNVKTLWIAAIWMLVSQWIDVMWMVQPEFFPEGPSFGWIEIGVTLGFLGLFAIAISRFLAKNNIVAIGDPRLVESVYHHHV